MVNLFADADVTEYLESKSRGRSLVLGIRHLQCCGGGKQVEHWWVEGTQPAPDARLGKVGIYVEPALAKLLRGETLSLRMGRLGPVRWLRIVLPDRAHVELNWGPFDLAKPKPIEPAKLGSGSAQADLACERRPDSDQLTVAAQMNHGEASQGPAHSAVSSQHG
jgi:hypothetical protein